VRLKAPASGLTGILAGYGNQAPAPPLGKNGRRIVNTVGVISERPLEGRPLSNRPVDQVAFLGMLQRINIGFTGTSNSGGAEGDSPGMA
jgi:hypothetical protein